MRGVDCHKAHPQKDSFQIHMEIDMTGMGQIKGFMAKIKNQSILGIQGKDLGDLHQFIVLKIDLIERDQKVHCRLDIETDQAVLVHQKEGDHLVLHLP